MPEMGLLQIFSYKSNVKQKKTEREKLVQKLLLLDTFDETLGI